MTATTRQVVDALKHRYIGQESTATNVSSDELAAHVRPLVYASLSADGSILAFVAREKTDWVLAGADIAVLNSAKDCSTLVFKLVDLEPEVELAIREITAVLAAELILNPMLPLIEKPFSIFSILDLLLDATIGWSKDQGRAGDNLLAKVQEVVAALKDPQCDVESLENNLVGFLQKEQNRTNKLEERLAASESGKLRSVRSRQMTAEMINQAMLGKKLTTKMSWFLQQPWYESLQLVALNKGLDSDDWQRAVKMTETIIWTLQPINPDREDIAAEKQKLYRIIEHLPSEISDLLVAFEQGANQSEFALNDIEADHFSIASGEELEYADFDPIPIESRSIASGTSVSRILLRKVNALQPGQWFTHDENDKNARIKLVLKLEDVKQMLFTNRNGMKALEKTFDEMAYLMSSRVIKPLNHEAVFSSTFATFYTGLIDEHQRKVKLAEKAGIEESEREQARIRALKEANTLARAKEDEEKERKEAERENRLERAKVESLKNENQDKLAEFTHKVRSLNVGAWLKLPTADGQREECRLAVKVMDKLIFVSRTGVKIGDYSSEQLITLLVAGEGEIDDTGVEFEDTLAQVVSKLRQDRDKSYDDLTGA